MGNSDLAKRLVAAAISLSFGPVSRFGLPGCTLTGGDGGNMNIDQYTQNFNFPFTTDG